MSGWLLGLLVVGSIVGAACVAATCLMVAILAANARHHRRAAILVQRPRNSTEND